MKLIIPSLSAVAFLCGFMQGPKPGNVDCGECEPELAVTGACAMTRMQIVAISEAPCEFKRSRFACEAHGQCFLLMRFEFAIPPGGSLRGDDGNCIPAHRSGLTNILMGTIENGPPADDGCGDENEVVYTASVQPCNAPPVIFCNTTIKLSCTKCRAQ